MEVAGAKAGPAKMWSLHAGSFEATNSMAEPEKITPVASTVKLGPKHTVPAYTIEVIDLPVN